MSPPIGEGERHGLPEGRLAAVHPASGADETREAHDLEAGPLDVILTVIGHPLGDLAAGTRLRVGDHAVVELTEERAVGGLRECPDGDAQPAGPSVYPARIVTAGTVRVGDPVVIEAVSIPLEDALDLHAFPPAEIPQLVREYLVQVHAAGFRHVRVIHGRGRGVQRAAVRQVLAASPLVSSFTDAPPERGGWGATLVELRHGPGAPP